MILDSSKRMLGGALAVTFALAGTLAVAQPAAAQQYSSGGQPGVADVSFVQGDTVIVRGDSNEQVGATVNSPLLPGDYLTTADGSRAEVQFDGISMLRLASNTQVRMVTLNAGSREVQLGSGTAELAEVQGGDTAQIDTPSVSVSSNQPGDYRVSVSPNGETMVTVRSGSATVSSQNNSQTLNPGSTLVAYGDYNNPSIQFEAPIAYDGFDNFNADRDREIVAAYNNNQYLAPGLAGYANFAQYGQWNNVPGYGESWAPYNQGNNWSPYSNGQWVWEPGYGYTWVGNEPWGYVPYHYGSWFWDTGYNEWMWQPPAYQYQNTPDAVASSWLPAMVAFFLTGGNPGAALGAFAYDNPYGYGNIGWVPLAPGEQYTPWYGGGANGYFPQTALTPVTNVTNVYNVYRNIRYVRVVRVVSVKDFRNGRFSHLTALPRTALNHLALVRGSVPVVPTRSVLGTRARTTIPVSSRFHTTPRFVAKQPVIVNTGSFDRQATALHDVVAQKPRVAPVTTLRSAPAHPVYQAPEHHETLSAPKQVRTTTQQRPVTQQHATTPEKRTTTPEQRPATPERFVPPAQRNVTAPEHTAVPAQRPEAPAQRPEAPAQRPEAPAQHPVAPERTAAPQRFAPPSQRQVTPQRTVTPERTPAPVEQRPVEQRSFTPPQEHTAPVERATAPEQRQVTPPEQRQVTPPEQRQVTPPEQRQVTPPVQREQTAQPQRFSPPEQRQAPQQHQAAPPQQQPQRHEENKATASPKPPQ